MTSPTSLLLGLVLACATSACSGDSTLTAPSSTAPAFTFASSFEVNGSASRTFEQLATGAVTVTLSAVSPDLRLGIGIGIPRAEGSGCNLARAVEVSAGASPHITTTAEPGLWCVRVWDVGTVTERVSFTLDVTHH